MAGGAGQWRVARRCKGPAGVLVLAGARGLPGGVRHGQANHVLQALHRERGDVEGWVAGCLCPGACHTD